MDPAWSKVLDSNGANTAFTSEHWRLSPLDPNLEADGVGEVEFLAAKKNPLDLLCRIVVSSNCSMRLMEIGVEVKFRATIDDDIFGTDSYILWSHRSRPTVQQRMRA